MHEKAYYLTTRLLAILISCTGFINIAYANFSEIELVDCSSCTDIASARQKAHSNSQFRDFGIYPTVVFNTSI